MGVSKFFTDRTSLSNYNTSSTRESAWKHTCEPLPQVRFRFIHLGRTYSDNAVAGISEI